MVLRKAAVELPLAICNQVRTTGEGFVNSDHALELMNQLLWNSMLIAGPLLLVALFVGLAVSVLQVATQLQEATLSYVPKLLACALVLAMLGPWLIGRLCGYAIATIALISQLS